MTLSTQAINDFIEAYRLDCGVVLSEGEARVKAEELITYTRVIARPIPQQDKMLGYKHNSNAGQHF